VPRSTFNLDVRGIREQIAAFCEFESPLSGEVEAVERDFGSKQFRGKRGSGIRGKTMVFGIFPRNGFVYTEIVPNV
jgi:hypothetical protein